MTASRPFRFAVQVYSADSGAEWRQLARRAEELGYSTLHLADHYIGPGPALDPTHHPVQELASVPAMMAAAAATSTLRIGCRVLCVGYHHPVVLAKELATIDLLSDGRLEAGLGAGWLAGEYEAMGVPFPGAGDRIGLLESTLDVVEACFSGAAVDVVGAGVHVQGFEGRPVPVQRPRPPLLVGGGGRRILGLAGRRADIVSLNFDNRSGVIGMDGFLSGGPHETREKIGWIRDGAGERFTHLELEIGSYFTTITDDDATVARTAAGLGMTDEQLRGYPHALAGSVDAVCDELARRREAYGISYVTVNGSAMEAFAPIVARLAGT